MSAYMGAAQFLSNKTTLEAATTILSVEGRQAAWVSSAVLKGSAWDGPFETALGPNAVFSIACELFLTSLMPPILTTNTTLSRFPRFLPFD